MDINQIALKQKVIAYLNNVIDSGTKKIWYFLFSSSNISIGKNNRLE